MSYGIFVNGTRPKSKKAVKEAVKNNDRIRLENTSLFPGGYDGDINDAPDGRYDFVGPDPYTKRVFYGNIFVSRDSENATVIKVA
jgi:hypothetical protein